MLLEITEAGLYCRQGNFYIDPWRPVDNAVITHAHFDHARPGCARYLAAPGTDLLLRTRLDTGSSIQTLALRRSIDINGVKLSLHPAGHILGSAQVRLEHRGEILVVSGDYKLAADPTCEPFEPVRCHTFVTEATYALPIYRWMPATQALSAINAWWKKNAERGKASLLFCYALGKAQRILAGIDETIGPIFTHGAVERITEVYRQAGLVLPRTTPSLSESSKAAFACGLILAPPSASGTPWLRRFGNISTGFASGWMGVRGMRRRKAIDRGFVLSDHADWPGLLSAIAESGAQQILVTHGYVPQLVAYLQESGKEAIGLRTPYEDVLEEDALDEGD